MKIEQRSHDLQIVLHAMMNFANQPGLAFEASLELSFVTRDGVGHAYESLAEIADLARRRISGRQRQITVARLVGRDCALHPRQRLEQQAVDDQPTDQRRRDPHQDRQDDDQEFDRTDRCRTGNHIELQASARDRLEKARRPWSGLLRNRPATADDAHHRQERSGGLIPAGHFRQSGELLAANLPNTAHCTGSVHHGEPQRASIGRNPRYPSRDRRSSHLHP
jgi:hypothetical protein